MKTVKVELTDVKIPVAQNYRDCASLIKSDCFRVYGKEYHFILCWIKTIRSRSLKYLFWMRLCSYKGLLYPFCKLRLGHWSKAYSIDIPPQTKIGNGLYLGHGMSIVINPTAIVGNNVNLSQCTTIGSNDGMAASIGDNVYIGPNVCLVENIKIGSDSLVGAGAVVVKDVPPQKTVVGVPARVVGENKNDYIKNKFCLE